MKNFSDYDRATGLFFLGVGIFFSLYARSVEIGNWHHPGPGFFPFWGGMTLGGMSVALLWKNFRRRVKESRPPFFPEKHALKRVSMALLALVAYVFSLAPLGFSVTTFFFLAFLLRFVFPQTWGRTILVALLGAVIGRLVFINLLATQLPRGVLGF